MTEPFSPSRRALLGAMATTAIAAPVAVAATASTFPADRSADAAIIAAWDAYRHATQAWDRAASESPEEAAAKAESDRAYAILVDAHPTTHAGAVALLRFVLEGCANSRELAALVMTENDTALAMRLDELDSDGAQVARALFALTRA